MTKGRHGEFPAKGEKPDFTPEEMKIRLIIRVSVTSGVIFNSFCKATFQTVLVDRSDYVLLVLSL